VGTPAIARSMGTVTHRSTSTGDSAGAAVITWTCTLVMSGTASMGSTTVARSPISVKSAVASRTTGRLWSDQRTIADRRDIAQSPSAIVPFSTMLFSVNAPELTTSSPSRSPETIST